MTRKTTTRRASGPPSLYRGKDRKRVITFTMTPDGHSALARLLATTRDISRSDLLESLIRDAARTTEKSA
jgi:DNA-binding MarR family transcriptional regulator